MKSLDAALRSGRRLRAMGFDDAPFTPGQPGPVAVVGVVFSDL